MWWNNCVAWNIYWLFKFEQCSYTANTVHLLASTLLVIKDIFRFSQKHFHQIWTSDAVCCAWSLRNWQINVQFSHTIGSYDDESGDCINDLKVIIVSTEFSWNTSLHGSQFSTERQLWLDNLGDTQSHVQLVTGAPSPGQITGYGKLTAYRNVVPNLCKTVMIMITK
jgi:hypothetical protein